MALETGTYISDLVETNPLGSDPKNQGDDHLRLIKSTVKTTFPNISGAVTPTHTELNYVNGVTSNIQTQIDTSGVKVNGFRSLTSPDTITASDVSVGLFYNSASAGSCTLPALSALNNGDTICISNLGAGLLTVNRAGADTIFAKGQNNATSIILQVGESIQLYNQSGAGAWLQLTGNNGIGSGGQVWQNMVGSRSMGTTYTNTSGRPIVVSVNIISTAIGTIAATVDGVAIHGSGSSATSERRFVNFVVPNNATYNVKAESGTPTIFVWAELR